MTAQDFRAQLRDRLNQNTDQVVLRIALSSDLSAPVEFTGRRLIEAATQIASRYAPGRQGVVLILLPHSVELFLLQIGLVLQGAIPAILAWPTSRIDAEKYQRNLLHQLHGLPAAQLITIPALAKNLAEFLPFEVTSCEIERAEEHGKNFATRVQIDAKPREAGSKPGLPMDALFLQFSGGTTGAQKCVVVSADMLEAQLRRLRQALSFSAKDGVVSWLPMYHDMGLIACLWLPLWAGAASTQFAASDWLLQPELLFRYMESYGGTFCWLPNFAFSYMAAQRNRFKGTYNIGQVRAFINCSEPVRQHSMQEFTQTFADFGITSASAQTCYAMAENVFAVTQSQLEKAPAVYSRAKVSQNAVAFDQTAYSFLDEVYVSSGKTIAGMKIRIRDNAGRDCNDHEPGMIELHTESLFDGYWGNDGFVSSSFSEDGWYSTGDFGFIVEGELFVIGRVKDIIIVGGQNVFPEDLEILVNGLAGVYAGRVVAFGLANDQYGTESIAVIAEMKGEYKPDQARLLEREIHKLILAVIGIAPRHVKVVPERWIVKSTAGKISRKETRERFLHEQEQKVHAIGGD